MDEVAAVTALITLEEASGGAEPGTARGASDATCADQVFARGDEEDERAGAEGGECERIAHAECDKHAQGEDEREQRGLEPSLQGWDEAGAEIQVFINPLMQLLWFGGFIYTIGGLLAYIPARVPVTERRTAPPEEAQRA